MVVSAALLVAPWLGAQTALYWPGGTGTWDTTTAQWSTTDDGLGALQAWSNDTFDFATFGLGAGTVTLSAPVSIGSLTFTTDGYTLTGGTLTLGATGSVDTGSGTQTISSILAGAGTSFTKIGGGTLVLNGANTYTGSTAIGAGTLKVSGSGASIGVASASASTMTVGSTADATLRIDSGGSVKNTSAVLGSTSGTKGTVVVDGAGSSWNITNTSGTTLSIASGGNGAVTVSNGGSVTLARPVSFSTTAGHTGDLLVDGAGSTFTSTTLNLQGAGTGTLTVSNGGTITSSNSSLGNSSGTGGTVTALVTGAGSKWNVNSSGTSSVTMYGDASLTIADGGTVNVGWSFYLGETTTSLAKVTVGNASTLNVANAAFAVGDSGQGTLEVNAGGTVNAGYNFRIGNADAAVGIVNQNGGTVTVSRYIEFFKGTAEYHLLGGTLVVGDGSGSAGIATPTATSYLFELGGGKLQVLGDSNSSLTNYANMTLKSGTTSTLDTPAGGLQAMYLQGVVSGSGNLATTGGGTVVLNKANTFTGSLTIGGGTVRYGIANALSTSTNIVFNGGVLEFGATPVALTSGTGGRQIQWLGDGGFSSYNGSRTIDYEGGAALTWGAGNFVPDGHVFLLGSSTYPAAGGTTTFANAIDFGGAARTVQVSDGSVAVDAILSGVLSNGALVKTGAGTLSLTNASNSYTGGTTINGGGIAFVSGALGSGDIALNGGELQWASGNTQDLLAGNRTVTFGAGTNTLTIAGSNDSVTFSGDIGGTGSFTKSGAGTLILSGNNTYSGGTTTLSGGTLVLASANALPASGNLIFAGGALSNSVARTLGQTVTLSSNATLGGSADLTFTGTLTNSGGNRTLTASNSGLTTLGNIFLSETTNARTLTLAGAGNIAVTGTIANRSGAGSNASNLTKSGTGTVTLSGANTFTGTLTASAGTLRATTNAAALGAGTLTLSGAALQLANDTGLTFNRATTVSAATTITSDRLTSGAGVTHTLGTLSIGAQTLTLAAGANVSSGTAGLTFGTVTATGNATFSAGAGTQLTFANLTGTNRSLTFTGAGAITSGAVTTGSGTLTKTGTGTLTFSGTNTYSGATAVNAGTLRVNGTATSSAIMVNSGGTLGGSGTVGTLTVASGATLAPGNSPGTLHAGNTTFAGGGTFQLELNNATGAAGTNWDVLAINGALTFNATSANPFSLDLTSLTSGNVAGLAANFDPTSDYSFTFLTTTGGVSGFSSDAFAIDTTHFTNPFTGSWSVSLTNSGHDLTLNYAGSAIPEPSTYAILAGLAALGLGLLHRRRTGSK